MAGQSPKAVYASNGWEIDLARRELRCRGVSVPIGSRALEIIEVLARSGGELVNKYDLMGRVWPGAVVEENTLQFHISAIRKALGADRDLLKTVSGRGYRLLGDWTVREAIEPGHPAGSAELQSKQPFRTNVPLAGSALIGRAASTQHLLDILSAYRVVTLTGPGGIGKSVLALEVARSLFPTLMGDCWLVELAALSDPALVPSAVASVLGLRIGGNTISAESVARAIDREKLLLVLDNCEHLAAAAAGIVETIVRMCPNVLVLTTSQEILRIDGECVYRVPPLEVPPSGGEEAADIDAYSAVQLFTARLTALDSGSSALPESLPVIAEICRRLDGIPLAIEFAAARVATLGLQQIADRLNDRFSLLTAGRRTALPRHQTLRATLDWSYELLPQQEQALLRRLGIFVGGFTLDAVTAVMSDNGATASAVAEGIASLAVKSLVSLETSAVSGRWRLLETIRVYAQDKLAEHGEADRAARRHAEFFRDLFAPATESALVALDDLPRYAREIDNLRAALDWAFSSRGDPAIAVELTIAAIPLWLQLSLLQECGVRAEQAMTQIGPGSTGTDRQRMQLWAALGIVMTHKIGFGAKIIAAWTNVLDAAERLGDTDYKLRSLWGTWVVRINGGEYRSALKAARQFASVAAARRERPEQIIGYRLVGNALYYLGDLKEARQQIEHMLNEYAPADRRSDLVHYQFDQRVMAGVILSRILWTQGFAEQAMSVAKNSLEEALKTNHPLSICISLAVGICQIALAVEGFEEAQKSIAMLIDYSQRHTIDYWNAWAHAFRGVLEIQHHDAKGLGTLEAALDGTTTGNRFAQNHLPFLTILAEALLRAGNAEKALVTVDTALGRCERDAAYWFIAEILRVKGVIALGHDDPRKAEECFLRSLYYARRQEALAWELRTTISIARLRRDQGRLEEARNMLASVYARFKEGHTTADLRAAKMLLNELG